jgi:hypothetical protein
MVLQDILRLLDFSVDNWDMKWHRFRNKNAPNHEEVNFILSNKEWTKDVTDTDY